MSSDAAHGRYLLVRRGGRLRVWCRWHSLHPVMFSTTDGSGKFDLWNLNTDREVRCCLIRFIFRVDEAFRFPWCPLLSAPAEPSTRCNGTRRMVVVSLSGEATGNCIFTTLKIWASRGSRSERIWRQRTVAGFAEAGQGGHGDGDSGARVMAGR